ncbi:hypothetical protein [Roseobacter sp. TSBP12]|uniref:hypothetical protein n=1 Tax=Roseobacter sp. TSBP12 TaxID=1236613 RepID=UPI00125EA911|nr:hypothetical protein [Roseobacter sp. TSBP12]KAB6715137.1 hypothetical protein C8029_17045 [Roseobacter sp. TSBP12]
MANGVNTDNIDPVAISDEVLVNRDGSTGRQQTANLGIQLANSGAIGDALSALDIARASHEDRLASVEATQTTNMVYAAAWTADLDQIAPAYIGQGAEIVDEAGGSHIDPSTGQSVLDAGRYKSYGTAVGAWTRISDTGLAGKASTATLRTAGVYHCTAVQDGVDPNLVLLTNPDVPAAPTEGMRITFIAPFTNTGNLKLKINGGAVLDVTQLNNGAVFAGAITVNYPYEFTFFGAPSNKYKLTTVLYSTSEIHDRLVAKPDTFGGTANALTVTLRQAAVDRQLLLIKPTAPNTGPATLNVKSAADVASGGAGTTTGIVNMNGTPITADTLVVGRFTLLMRDASGGNPWRILADGVNQAQIDAILADMSDLDGRITSLESASGVVGAWENEAEALCNKIIGPTFGGGRRYADNPRDPKNWINYVNGVRSLDDPAPFKILNCGCSINTGAGAQDDGASNPGLVLSNMLAARFGAQHNIDVQYESVAVGGTVVSQFVGQLQGATMQDPDIVIGANPKNNATVAALHQLGPQTIYDQYVALIRYIRDDMGAMPIIMGTYHEHTHVNVVGFPDHYQSTWPVLSYNVVNQSATFDQATKRITMFGLASYGQMLQDGSGELPASKLRVTITGEAEFTVTVAAINWATSEITTVEDLAYDGTFTASVKHLPVDEAQLLWDTPAPLLVRKIRSPGGEALLGWYHDDVVNQIVYDACRDEGCGYLDMQKWQFGLLSDAWRTGNYTDETLFNVMFEKPVDPLDPDGPTFVEFNHANQQSYASFNNAMFTPFCSAIEYRRLYAQREF